MEDFAFGVELFVIIFSFLCWLVTPPVEENFSETPLISEIPEVQEEVSEVKKEVEKYSKVINLQESANRLIDNLPNLKIKEIRQIAKCFGVKQREQRKTLSKAQLVERIITFINQGEEEVLLENFKQLNISII